MSLVEKQLQFTSSGAAEFVLWMVFVIFVAVMIGIWEDKNGRGR